MKQKLISLLTLLLCVCSGAWADGTINAASTTDLGKGNTPRYVVKEDGVGCLMKNKTGSSSWSLSSSYLTTGSNLFALQTYLEISQIVVHGYGTSNGRTFSKLEIGTTTSNYAEDVTAKGEGTMSSTQSDQTITITPSSDIAANSYVAITLSGNICISSVVLVEAETGTKYTVSYDKGEGTGTMSGAEYVEGKSFELPACSFTAPDGKGFAGWLCSIDGVTYAAGDPYTMTAAATTFTAQYAKAAQKVIYSLTGGIGSAEVHANDATVNEGTSLLLSNTAGRIKLTASTGEQFKNGDAISISGIVGDYSKSGGFGIYYGTTEAANNGSLNIEGESGPLATYGVINVGSPADDLYIRRYAGTSTTIQSLVISRTLLVSSEALNGVKINGVAGIENTDYSIEGNIITLSNSFVEAPTVQLINRITFADSSTSDEPVNVTLNLVGAVFTGTATIGATTYTVNAPINTTPNISADNVDIDADATAGSIIYSLINSVVGGEVTAAKTTEADWLTLGAVSAEAVAFTTTANTGAERSATVRLTYTYNTDQTVTTDVTINQAVRTYDVTFSAGEGTGTVPTEEPKVDGAEFTLPGQGVMVAPANKYFIGWNDGTSDYAEGETYTMSDEAVTFTAQWTALPVAVANHYKYSYNDAQHYVNSTYRNPRGGIAASGDNQSIPNGNLCENLGGISTVAITSAQFDGKGTHMNAYLKIAKGGSAKVTITIADGYVGTLTLKANGYSANAGILVSDAMLKTGEEGGEATIEDNFNTLVYTLPAGTHDITCDKNNMYISEMDIVTRATVTVTVGAKGYATYVNSDYTLDFTGKSIKAYVASSNVAAKTVTLTQVNKLGKNTPVLLYSETNNDSQTIPAIADSEAETISENYFRAGDGTTSYTWTDSERIYVLNTAGTPGFYKANSSKVATNKAYLLVPNNYTLARFAGLGFEDDGEATGIKSVETTTDGSVFNLRGQRVAQPQKGLYILNGKKVVLK